MINPNFGPSIRVSYVGAQPVIQWAEFAHKAITSVAFQLSGIEDKAVGTDRTVKAPWGNNPSFSTKIHAGDKISDILINHSVDPDLFALDIKKQLEHGAITLTKTGYAPDLAANYLNWAIQEKAVDLKYLYLSWALHFLEDCGMPYHTTLNVIIQTTHFAVEGYADANLPGFSDAMHAAAVQDITSLYGPAWQLAESVAPDAPVIYAAWTAAPQDLVILKDTLADDLTKATGYAAGAIRNLNALFIDVPPCSWLTEATVILIPAAAVGLAATKGGKHA